MSDTRWAGISAARQKLALLVRGLEEAATGAVVARAVAKVQEQIASVAKSRLAKHVDTGAAQSSMVVTVQNNVVLLSTNSYLRFHGWWPFRSGMPPFVVNRALKIFEAELVAAVGGKQSPLLLAEESAEEAAAVKSRAKFAKDVAKIYRHSEEGKAKRKAEAKDRAMSRAHDKRVKAREDRE